MSGFFPQSFLGAYPQQEYSLTPLFRLLDDFDSYRDNTSGQPSAANSRNARNSNTSIFGKTFSPKFDVKETQDSYELHGELPGIEQKDIEIEFTDHQTLAIRGRSERTYESGTSPDKLLGQGQEQAKLTQGGEDRSESHRATVEDEEAEKAREAGQQVTSGAQQQQQQKGEQPQERFWVSERSVGEFARSFHFPTRVDQDAVKASMKNGILSIVVPKAQQKQGSRKIQIS